MKHVTSWAPTEGARRADWLLREFEACADLIGIEWPLDACPILHQQVFSLIATEIDHALAFKGGPVTHDASVAGNGYHAGTTHRFTPSQDVPATADPVGYSQEDYEAVARTIKEKHLALIEPKKRGRPAKAKPYVAAATIKEEGTPVSESIQAAVDHWNTPFDVKETPLPKKRGRPKGAKGKKAKAGRKAKVEAAPIEVLPQAGPTVD